MKIIQALQAHNERIADIVNAIDPGRGFTAQDIEEGDKSRDPKFKFQRWVCLEGEIVVGVGSYSQSVWFAHPRKFMIGVSVHPEYQRQGIGNQLYETILMGLQPFDPLALRANASEERPGGVAFLEKRGFREVIRDIPSQLDVHSFDPSRFSNSEENYLSRGIQIKTFKELEDDPERDQKLYDLDWELSMSVPGDLAAGMARRGLEKYIEYAITGPSVIPEAFFIAVKGDEYIGLSHALKRDEGVSLYQALTGVKPQFRRLGLGLAMKLKVIAYAKKAGYAHIIAENDAKNLPMLAMNEKLGYQRKPAQITMEKNMQMQEALDELQ